jgi:hypothetical protein
LLENLSKTLEASDMAEDGSDFETPQPVEPTEPAPDPILASRTDENSFLTMDGYNNGVFQAIIIVATKLENGKSLTGNQIKIRIKDFATTLDFMFSSPTMKGKIKNGCGFLRLEHLKCSMNL